MSREVSRNLIFMKWIYRFYYTGIAVLFTLGLCNKIIIDRSENYLFNSIEEVPPKETALVLGASKNYSNGNINQYFKNRMETAAELYHSGKVKQILVSGDNHIKEYDETTDMANYLISLGVPKDKIILDYAGFRTLDSVIRAKKVFNCSALIIVTQKFHNQRAVYVARKNGIDAVGLNSPDVGNQNNYTHARELLAKTLMIFDIHLFKTKPKFL